MDFSLSVLVFKYSAILYEDGKLNDGDGDGDGDRRMAGDWGKPGGVSSSSSCCSVPHGQVLNHYHLGRSI